MAVALSGTVARNRPPTQSRWQGRESHSQVCLLSTALARCSGFRLEFPASLQATPVLYAAQSDPCRQFGDSQRLRSWRPLMSLVVKFETGPKTPSVNTGRVGVFRCAPCSLHSIYAILKTGQLWSMVAAERRQHRRRRPGSVRGYVTPFVRALAEARRAAGLTQAGLAARLGTTQSAIARLERGEVVPSVTTLAKLADALGIEFEVRPRSGVVIREPSSALRLVDLRARREELLAIAARYGARNVRVFGSVARGDARSDSDVDFLVELEPDRTVLDLSGLVLDLEETLGRKVRCGRGTPPVRCRRANRL